MRDVLKGALLPIVFISCSAVLQASSLNIDFGGFYGAPSSSFGAAANQAGFWNQIVNFGVTNNLLDLGGVATTVSLNLAALANAHSAGGAGSDTGALRGDSLYGSPWSFTLSNLTNGLYDFYYYAGMGGLHTSQFTVNGVIASDIVGGSSATLNQGSDWEVLHGISVTDGTLEVKTNVTSVTYLAGIQLVQNDSPVPEPSTLSLSLIGAAMGIAAVVRRYKPFSTR